eukprot:CAMPEP_0185258130 /NCGR_PEP_ID=MMETSP1359-20130426/7103_1 /TAXON_ID=552665 /ORGANISM="Bigelowiella longifila, Strain CCMP242" /LENGTH=426 /DNA_ID=CAMNT_0027843499 /DNA_START=125 /DNA_END=1405 /DNA_ORIENTATION=+
MGSYTSRLRRASPATAVAPTDRTLTIPARARKGLVQRQGVTSNFYELGLGVPRIIGSSPRKGLQASARLSEKEKEQAADISKKMKKAGWTWPLTEVFESQNWDEIRNELDMSPVDAFSLVVSVTIYFKAAAYVAATYLSLQIIEGLPNENNWSFVAAACAGYFGIGALRQLLTLRAQYELNKEILQLDRPDEVMREAMEQISDSGRDEQRRRFDKLKAGAKNVEWDPEGLLPPRDEPRSLFWRDNVEEAEGGGEKVEEGGLIAGLASRRAEEAVDKFRGLLVTAVRQTAEKAAASADAEGSAAAAAAAALASLDSLMSGYASPGDGEITAEALGVEEELLEAAEKVFRRYNDSGNDVLTISELREMARKFDLQLPGDKELSLFAEGCGGSDNGRLNRADFLRFWADSEKASLLSQVDDVAVTTVEN